jgi:hypothetical protein
VGIIGAAVNAELEPGIELDAKTEQSRTPICSASSA